VLLREDFPGFIIERDMGQEISDRNIVNHFRTKCSKPNTIMWFNPSLPEFPKT
jgi:hypothetical protein